MTVRAGADGLDAAVTWAHVFELEDPVPYVEGGELILTGGWGMPRNAQGQVQYVQRLHKRGVAGVAIVRHSRVPRLTRALLEEADEIGFPVLELPPEVSFVDIARLVAAANDDGGHQRLMRHLQIFETLQEYQASDAPVEDLVWRLSKVSGFDVYVSSPAGTAILPGVPAPPGELAEHVADLSADFPAVPGGYSLPVVVGGRTAARLTAVKRDGGPPGGLAAAQHLATVVGIPLRDVYQRREAERREGAEVLSELLLGRGTRAESAGRLVERGFEPMKDLVVAVVRSLDERFDDAEIHHRLCDRLLPSLLVTRDDLLLVVPDVEAAIEAIEQVDFELAVGVSAPFAAGAALAVPWRQARWSMERAVARRERLVRFAATDAAGEWLPIDRGELRGVVEDVLGPVLRYDATSNSDLIESLRTLFRHDRRLKDAAAELGIHQHTLSYRMRTVERLSGRSLKGVQGLVDLWLAMKALDVLVEERDEDLSIA
jgi:PucR family transcriptional regulator, purine catabolism regulatory protein